MSNLIVGQSGGPTAVINASLAGVIEEAKGKFEQILGMRRGVEGLLAGETVDLTGMAGRDLDVLARTPGAALGSCRHKVTDADVDTVIGRLRDLDVGCIFYIGGNDSADTTYRISRRAAEKGSGLRAIAVPKTVDNDLPEMDHTPGYPSAARYVATAVAESTLDTRSLPVNYPVKVVEVMGRDAGWLAAASALARDDERDGPHLIYVPELPFDAEAFVESVNDVHSRIGYVVVVVAETVRDAEGEHIGRDVATVDMFGHPIVRGAGEALMTMVERRLNLTTKFEKPGSLQRSSWTAQSPIDLMEAREAGREAVRLAIAGRTGLMVTIERLSSEPYGSRMSSVDIERIANRQRLLPREYLDSAGTNVTQAFKEYALPLLGPDPFPQLTRL